MLERYETTFVYCPDRFPDNALRAGARTALGDRLERALGRRAAPGIPSDRVRRSPEWDLLRIAATQLGAGDVLADRLWERMTLAFDAGVASRLQPSTRIVYGFEQGCRATLTRAAELGVHGVLDMAAPHFAVTEPMLAAEVESMPELRTPYWIATRKTLAARNQRKQDEFERAALIVANSQFTASTLEGTGVAREKVRVVPLGAPEIDRSWRDCARATPPRVLFVGSISTRKGAHLLLDAWRALRPGNTAELLMVGQWLLPERWRRDLPAGVRVLKWLTRPELREQYLSATALVLPSLLDGFGMVVTEALAHGLPVITTRNTGAADLIEAGRNGWVIGAGDVEALAERLQHCIERPAELEAMREAAERSAAQRPWSVYRTEIVDAVSASLSP
jgi:glycosyltransferase involved in cell wall biosynthesis